MEHLLLYHSFALSDIDSLKMYGLLQNHLGIYDMEMNMGSHLEHMKYILLIFFVIILFRLL